MTKTREKELVRTTKAMFIYRFRRTIEEAKAEGANEEEIFELISKCFPDSLNPAIVCQLYDWFMSGASTRIAKAYDRRLPEEFRCLFL